MRDTVVEEYLTLAATHRAAVAAAYGEDAAHDAILGGANAVANRRTIPEDLRSYLLISARNRRRRENRLSQNEPICADSLVGGVPVADTLSLLLARLRTQFGAEADIYLARVCGEPPREIARRRQIDVLKIYRIVTKIKQYLHKDPICQELKHDAYD